MEQLQIAETGGLVAREFRVRKVLLIYQVGNSDLYYGEGPVGAEIKPAPINPKTTSFRDMTAGILSDLAQARANRRPITLTAYGKAKIPDGISYTRSSSEAVAVQFPIFPVVVHWLAEKHRDARILLWPILTDQRTDEYPHGQAQDTIGMDCLLQTYLDLVCAENPAYQILFGPQKSCDPASLYGQIEDPHSHTTMTLSYALVHCNPTNYRHLGLAYEAIHEYLKKESIPATDKCYYAVGTGTPQMAYAGATAFGFDARINFIYKPNVKKEERERVEEITHFRELLRERALKLLGTSVAQFNFALASRILGSDTSGFPPDDLSVAEKLQQLNLLADWQRLLFANAVQCLDGATPGELGRLAGLAVYRLCHTLQHHPANPADRIRYWRMALTDALIRLRMWLMGGDIPAFIFGLDRFLDLVVTFGITAMRPGIDWSDITNPVPDTDLTRMQDVHVQQKANLKQPLARLGYLLWLIRTDPSGVLRPLVEPLLTFRLIIDSGLVRYRHEYVHAVVTLDRDVLDDFVADWCSDPLPTGHGGWVVLALAEAVVAAIPPDPAVVPPNPVAFFSQVESIPEELAKAFLSNSVLPDSGWPKPLPSSSLDPWRISARAQFADKRRDCQRNATGLVDRTRHDLIADLRLVRPNLSVTARSKLDLWLGRLDATSLPSAVIEGLIEQYLVDRLDPVSANKWIITELIRTLEPDWLTPPKYQDWATWRKRDNQPDVRAQSARRLLV